MKPPRVFVKQGSFWLSCYVEGEPNDWRWPTGIKLDPKFVTALEKDPHAFKDKKTKRWLPDWWKTSKYAPDIKEAIKAMTSERELFLAGRITRPSHKRTERTYTPTRIDVPDLLELVNELNEEGSAEEVLSSQTTRRRVNSANTILRFVPQFTINMPVDKKWIARFRKWMSDPKIQQKPFTNWTQYTLLMDLKLFFKFAHSKRYIERNPLADISFTQPESLVRHTPIEDEFTLFRHLYDNDLPRFTAFITQRLTGYRFSDVINLRRPHLDLKNKLFVNARNVKGRRPELFPIADALYYVYTHLADHLAKDYLFPDTYAAATKALEISADAAGIRYTSHQCKRNYSLEIEDENPLQHIFDFLMHHKTKSTAGRHYTAQNLALMRKTLNDAQQPWMTFVKELLGNEPLWRKRIRSEVRLKNRD